MVTRRQFVQASSVAAMATRIRLLIAVVIAMGAFPSVARSAVPESRTVTIWDCDSVRGVQGLVLERDNVTQGQAAVRWRDHTRLSGFSVPDVPPRIGVRTICCVFGSSMPR